MPGPAPPSLSTARVANGSKPAYGCHAHAVLGTLRRYRRHGHRLPWRYFPWLETGRDEYLYACGYSYRELEVDGILLAVIETQARFRASARYDDPIFSLLYTGLRELDRARLRFAYAVYQESTGQVLVEAETAYAFINRAGEQTRITHHPAVWARLQAILQAPLVSPSSDS